MKSFNVILLHTKCTYIVVSLFIVQTVNEPIVTLSISTTDNDYKLFCWLSGFSPKQIDVDWIQDDQLINLNKELKLFSVTPNENAAMSQITIKPAGWNEGSVFTCSVKHNNKIFNKTLSKCEGQFCKNSMNNTKLLRCLTLGKYHIFLFYIAADPAFKPPIRLQIPGLQSVLTNSQQTVSCVVETAYSIKVSWFVNGNSKSIAATMLRSLGGIVSNMTLSTEEWNTLQTITCKAEHRCFTNVEQTFKVSGKIHPFNQDS